MFYFYKSFWSVLKSQALETPQLGFPELNGHKSCWTWTGSAPKPPRPSPEPSPEPCWTWPGSAPKPPRPSQLLTFSGTFSGTLLNLTWLLPRHLLRNLLRNPVEPDLALHQSFPDLLRNLLRNPFEPDPALHQSLRNLLRNPDLALHQSLPDLLQNIRNLLWNLVGPDPAPAPVHTGAILDDPISLCCRGKNRKCHINPLFGGVLVNRKKGLVTAKSWTYIVRYFPPKVHQSTRNCESIGVPVFFLVNGCPQRNVQGRATCPVCCSAAGETGTSGRWRPTDWRWTRGEPARLGQDVDIGGW